MLLNSQSLWNIRLNIKTDVNCLKLEHAENLFFEIEWHLTHVMVSDQLTQFSYSCNLDSKFLFL